ncbi:pyridoxamine 5'-phosphate oxidase [Dyadobacter sediminis]|uniref:Pyridoxine/pyridoxamine 5'-phosphate oxidase n=1 Tax=Dyadobacter sediminis TaxID=1493691 RepID=A0A5R9KJG2_9BACT|nr:pyridoxamine 5'-phosphate oxidase [Dyadobacter sediminis]TLU96353.1 pyridoxamine 5'-phosphate oxidase [Dyadobacter sediminis]GGB81539.1 pyridoxine/pyridoxamine 5'-phosphate oxidase [Dyadobacter sediminis]
MDHKIAKIRHDYNLKGLLESDLEPNPLNQFRLWFGEALNAGITEPNAMTLSTVFNGRPSARIVLLKDLDTEGFTFFTNYNSKKGREIASEPQVALTFFWKEFERQVRIEGKAEKTSDQESSEYFAVRPRGSQIGAWTSYQSEVIENRAFLENRTKEIEQEFNGREVPRPPHWGGYRVIPDYIEFWQGRPSRLHDRLSYVRSEEGSWLIERLSP